MYYFMCALYREAAPLIRIFGLKKETSSHAFDIFTGTGACLIITGPGSAAAAAGTAHLLTRYPPDGGDFFFNYGCCGCSDLSVPAGSPFLIGQIMELSTGRLFYPDLLYAAPYQVAGLTTCPSPVGEQEMSGLRAEPGRFLFDMEGAAAYQSAAYFLKQHQIALIKVVSDHGSERAPAPDKLEAMLSAPAKLLPEWLSRMSAVSAPQKPPLAEQEDALIRQTAERLHFTEAMKAEFGRLCRYAALSGFPVAALLAPYNEDVFVCKSKKEGKICLEQLKAKLIPLHVADPPALLRQNLPASDSCVGGTGFCPAFSRIYIEEAALSYPLTDAVKSRFPDACVIPVKHYKDVFNRKHQDFYLQKQSPALILAVKKGTLIYPGAPVCQNFGNSHFYYTSSVMNCIYDCEYCYLQGMYPSANPVLFVNLDDTFQELDRLLKKHPVYLCVSYDTDLLALEGLTGYARRWIDYAETRRNLQIELRTKSASYSLLADRKPSDNVILAWTLSPERVAADCEHRVPSLNSRLRCANRAAADGWPVRLCFDPLIMLPDALQIYREFIGQVFDRIPAASVRDVSIGTFRISAEYLKRIRKSRPACAVLSYPFEIRENVATYPGDAGKILLESVRDFVRTYVEEDRIFLYQTADAGE